MSNMFRSADNVPYTKCRATGIPIMAERQPPDCYPCGVCSRLTMESFVPESRMNLGICEDDACLDVRIAGLIATELDAFQYESALQRIAAQVVPMHAEVNVGELQSLLLAIVLRAAHEIGNADDRRKK